jgi:hypothetical protein
MGDHATVVAERERSGGSSTTCSRTTTPNVMSILRGRELQNALVDESGLPSTAPDALAGPFAHVVLDEAREPTDTASGTARRRGTGSASRCRSGSSGSGSTRVTLASVTINYRTPQEVMVEAEPVSAPCCRTPTCRRPSAAAASPSSTDLLWTWARSSTGWPLPGRVRHADASEELTRVGDAYHWAAGHTGWKEEPVAFLEFGPVGPMRQFSEHARSEVGA